ncbi:hypothetical protein [Halorhabdus amylolytica]|uniref:hypothetical protein n=1 Tax=Halorhabdus amylolytica TaxID=2559573 RepID=UPI0010AA831E|nr:hypothetical protein [Halorhabdus amylolytica]
MRGVTRQAVLGLGGATIATLAGCSGGSGSPTETATATGTETTTMATQPSSLSIENVHFCREQPTGYRQYTEQPGATYEPGDIVWVYFEPSTVGTEPAGEGERRFSYELTWTVRGPEGEEIDTITRTIDQTALESADFSDVFLTLSFDPPMDFAPGTHRMEIDIRDAIAGTEASTAVEFAVERELSRTDGSFGIPEIVFTTDEANGYDDYTRQPDAEYGPTESGITTRSTESTTRRPTAHF